MDESMIDIVAKDDDQPPCAVVGTTCLFKQLTQLNGEDPMSGKDTRILKIAFAIIAGIIITIVLVVGFFLTFPFKTVEFPEGAKVLNPGRRVPYNGVVEMSIKYHKWIPNKGLIVRTLIRRTGTEMVLLDSNTLVSERGVGSGTTHAYFYLNGNPNIIGPDAVIVFSIYYTLYGIRNIMVQYESEPFEIYKP